MVKKMGNILPIISIRTEKLDGMGAYEDGKRENSWTR